jgi:hypothetical protein
LQKPDGGLGRACAGCWLHLAPRLKVYWCGRSSFPGRRRLRVGSGDWNFQRYRIDPAFFPGVERQFDVRLAGGNGFRDLDQVLKAVASAALLECDSLIYGRAAGVLRRKGELAFGVGVVWDSVRVQHEREGAGPDARGSDAKLQHR